MIILVKREFFIISSIRKIFFPRVSVSIFLRLENRGGGDEIFLPLPRNFLAEFS